MCKWTPERLQRLISFSTATGISPRKTITIVCHFLPLRNASIRHILIRENCNYTPANGIYHDRRSMNLTITMMLFPNPYDVINNFRSGEGAPVPRRKFKFRKLSLPTSYILMYCSSIPFWELLSFLSLSSPPLPTPFPFPLCYTMYIYSVSCCACVIPTDIKWITVGSYIHIQWYILYFKLLNRYHILL